MSGFWNSAIRRAEPRFDLCEAGRFSPHQRELIAAESRDEVPRREQASAGDPQRRAAPHRHIHARGCR